MKATAEREATMQPVSEIPIDKSEEARLSVLGSLTGRASGKSVLTPSSQRSSISHYCPLIDSPPLIYGRRECHSGMGF